MITRTAITWIDDVTGRDLMICCHFHTCHFEWCYNLRTVILHVSFFQLIIIVYLAWFLLCSLISVCRIPKGFVYSPHTAGTCSLQPSPGSVLVLSAKPLLTKHSTASLCKHTIRICRGQCTNKRNPRIYQIAFYKTLSGSMNAQVS